MGTVLGSILDPAADKILMTTMVVSLAVEGLMPLSLAGLILARDVGLSLSAFWFRYKSLPEPVRFLSSLSPLLISSCDLCIYSPLFGI